MNQEKLNIKQHLSAKHVEANANFSIHISREFIVSGLPETINMFAVEFIFYLSNNLAAKSIFELKMLLILSAYGFRLIAISSLQTLQLT